MKKILFLIVLLVSQLAFSKVEKYELNIQIAFYIIEDDIYLWSGFYVKDDGSFMISSVGMKNLYDYEKIWIKNRNYKIIILENNGKLFYKLIFSIKKNIEVIEISREQFFQLLEKEST